MRLEDMILVSVDDHIIEPANMWDQHLAVQHKAIKPQLIKRNDGSEYWSIGGRKIESPGLCAAAGRVPEEYGYESERLDEMRAGCWDITSRIGDMNVNGVLASLNFPTTVGMDGIVFKHLENQDDALVLLRAYNDWHIDEWAGSYPGRIIPMAIVPYWNIPAAVAEVKRVVAKGCHAVSFSANPAHHGCPSIHDPAWEPLWKICAENEVVLNLHISTGGTAPHSSNDTPIDAWISMGSGSVIFTASDWLYLTALDRYPNLKIALTEGGMGWVPWMLERAEYTYRRHKAWTHSDFGPGRGPSDRFREHFLTCFIDDQFGLENLDKIGVDNVCFECDYPHSDSAWPNAPEQLWESVKTLPPATLAKITHENALRHYRFEAIDKMGGRENCTVGALRRLAKDVDTTLLSFGGVSPLAPGETRRPVTSGDIAKQLGVLNRN